MNVNMNTTHTQSTNTQQKTNTQQQSKRKKPKLTKQQAETLKKSDAAKKPCHEFSREASALLHDAAGIPKKLVSIIEEQAGAVSGGCLSVGVKPSKSSCGAQKSEGTETFGMGAGAIATASASAAGAVSGQTAKPPLITEHAKLVMERKQSALHCYLRACWMRLSRHQLQEMIE